MGPLPGTIKPYCLIDVFVETRRFVKQIAVFIALGAMLWFGFDFLLRYAEPSNATFQTTSASTNNLSMGGQPVTSKLIVAASR